MSSYTANPSFCSDHNGLTFPFANAQISNTSKALAWVYEDRRSMQEIVTGVFLGPMSCARDTELLDRSGIRTLVAVRTPATTKHFRPLFPEKYLYEPFDVVEGTFLSTLPRVKPFVDACLSRGERVLFYDETGNTKAAMLVCSYVMETHSLDCHKAYSLVASGRLSVSLNEHELYQLQEYETILTARKTIMSHSYSSQELSRRNLRRKHSACEDTEEEALALGSTSSEQNYRKHNPFIDVE